MALIYNKIVESNTEPSPNDLWLKDGNLLYYKGGWKKLNVEAITRLSQLENDINFVKKDALGSAAYKNVEEIVELVKQALNS